MHINYPYRVYWLYLVHRYIYIYIYISCLCIMQHVVQYTQNSTTRMHRNQPHNRVAYHFIIYVSSTVNFHLSRVWYYIPV